MNTKEIKELYGWNETLEKYSISTTPQLKKEFPGSFRVKKHKGKYFWYYRLSNDVKGRDKYLCSVEPNDLEPNQTSFEYAVGILMEKLRSKFVMGIRNKSYLHTYIIPFKEFIDDDKYLTSSVKSGRRNTIDRFGSWSKNEGVRLNIVPTNEMKNVFLKFIKFLENKGLQKSSIKAQLQIVRYFLNWLCEDKLLDGAELFPSHPISLNLQNELLKKHIKTIPRETKSFKNSYYTEGYEMCSKKIPT